MILKCLGSSSSGNCYLLDSKTECLVLEAGVKFSEVKKALDFNIGKLVGVVASHSHKDHFGHAEEYLKAGIPVYAPEETHKSLSRKYLNQVVVKPYKHGDKPYEIGSFKIYPFPAEHDVECFGYVISHPEMGNVIFATDTSFVRQNFKGIKPNHILIEANYSEAIINDLLSKGLIDQARVNRTFRTHMSIETCKEFVRANKTASLDSVMLLHLSDGNSNAEQFRREILDAAGNDVRVTVADRGVEVKLDLFPW